MDVETLMYFVFMCTIIYGASVIVIQLTREQFYEKRLFECIEQNLFWISI